MKICNFCGNNIGEEAKFCEFCGKSTTPEEKPVVEELMYCRNCGKKIRMDASFCKFCGESFKENQINLIQNNSNSEINSQKGDIWTIELIVAVVLASVSYFMPNIKFECLGYSKSFSLMNISHAVKSIGDFLGEFGNLINVIQITKITDGIESIMMIPVFISFGALITGVLFIIKYFDKRIKIADYIKIAKLTLGLNILCIFIMAIFLWIINTSFKDVILEAIKYMPFDEKDKYFMFIGNANVIDLSLYGMIQIIVSIINLLFIIPFKIDNNLREKYKSNIKHKKTEKMCIKCKTRYSEGVICPKCGCSICDVI